jgi:membrane protease YdiL (CAAX protease family)
VARKPKTRKPAKTPRATKASSSRSAPAGQGLLRDQGAARPLASLVFLAPLLVFYAIGVIWLRQDMPARADVLLRDALGWLGVTGYMAPTWMVVLILVVWHMIRRDPWHINWGTVGLMVAETAILSVPLILLVAVFNLASHGPPLLAISDHDARGWFAIIHASIGAGVFEELIFRLLMVGGTMFILREILKDRSAGASIAVILITAALFAGAHVLDNPQRFGWDTFLFRSAAGIYLGFVFLYRGFGVAAGTHILFDLVVRAAML